MTQKLKLVHKTIGDAITLLGDNVAVTTLQLLTTEKRFSELSRELPVSTKTLAARLKKLEHNGLVSRTFHAEIPPKTVYTLTTKGEEFLSLLDGLCEWEKSWE